MNHNVPAPPTSDPHIVYGETDAFPEHVLKWFNENDSMGYPFFPNSNKVIRAVHHVVDNETSLKNKDPEMRARLLDHIWYGPWMTEIRRLLPDPKLVSVEVHLNGNTSKGNTHRDHDTHPTWIVVVPLGQGGTREQCGGTYVFRRDGSEGHSVACERNRYFIFPAHNLHYREPSLTVEASKLRRVMFIIFTDQEKLPVANMATGRSLHSRLKARGIRKPTQRSPFTMALRKSGRPKCDGRGSRDASASIGTKK